MVVVVRRPLVGHGDAGADVSASDESPGGHGHINFLAEPIIPVWEQCVTCSAPLPLLVPGCGSLIAMTTTRRLLTVAGGRSLDVFVVGAEGAPLVPGLAPLSLTATPLG